MLSVKFLRLIYVYIFVNFVFLFFEGSPWGLVIKKTKQEYDH